MFFVNQYRVHFFIAALLIQSLLYSQGGEIQVEVIIPSKYEQEKQFYPLVVAYSQTPKYDDLLTEYSERNECIVLKVKPSMDGVFGFEELKKKITKIRQEFSVKRDQLYLLGIEENIRVTADIKDSLRYYFAATAFVSNRNSDINSIGEGLIENSRVRHFKVSSFSSAHFEVVHDFFLKSRLWEVDIQKISRDAEGWTEYEYEDQWLIGLNYGRWYSASTSRTDFDIISLPDNMAYWNLFVGRSLTNHLSINVSTTFLFKVADIEPDYVAISNGDEVDIEGGGLTFLPFALGLDYSFLDGDYRPYIGLKAGVVVGRVKLVEASGNINQGIETIETNLQQRAPFMELSTGIKYRAGQNVELGLNLNYAHSKDFDRQLVGFLRYQGVSVSAGLTIVF